MLFLSAVEQVGAFGERGRQELVARQKQDREFRALLELFPVTLSARARARALPPGAHAAISASRRVRRPQPRPPRDRHRAGSWRPRRAPRFGHPHEQVRAQRAALGSGPCSCSVKSQCSDHAGQFDHATQRDFTPSTAHFRAAKRGGQVGESPVAEDPAPFTRFRLARRACRKNRGVRLLEFFLSRQRGLSGVPPAIGWPLRVLSSRRSPRV